MTAGQDALVLSGVGKRFGQVWAVRNLNLSIPSGVVHALLGPNGAGKTTTLRLLAGLLHPTEGVVRVAGWDPTVHWMDVRRVLSYVPDIPFLYAKLTGEEFLRFVGGLHGLDGRHLQERIDWFVDLFQLHQYHRRRVESYSHGVRQKYVLAAALLWGPRVLLVDEPLVGLDPLSARTLKDLLRRRAAEGTCVVISTHTLSVAQEVADAVTVLHRGSALVSGPTADLLRSHGGSLEDFFLALTAA